MKRPLTVKQLKEVLDTLPDDMRIIIDDYEYGVGYVSDIAVVGACEYLDSEKTTYSGTHTLDIIDNDYIKEGTYEEVFYISRNEIFESIVKEFEWEGD
jgi:hypothetical protein